MTPERPFNLARDARRAGGRVRAFTVIELLIVMGVIGILAVITVVGSRRLTSSSRLAAGTNAVTNMLGTTRAAAIRDAATTALVFRPVWDPTKRQIPQRVEMVVVRSTGERVLFTSSGTGDPGGWAERFLPVPDIAPVQLPEGIKVAGPMYDPPGSVNGVSVEQIFATQAELPVLFDACGESFEFNRTIAVLFGPQGEFLTRPPAGAITIDMKCYVDWNRNGSRPNPPADPQDVGLGNCASNNFERYWLQDHPDDECNMLFVPYLSVYDDRAAREVQRVPWTTDANMLNDLTGPNGYILQFGDRITFNRFSGIPERKVQ